MNLESTVALEKKVKDYYRNVENYDWSHAADNFIGLETFFHRARCREVLKLVRQTSGRAQWLDVGCGTAMITRHLPHTPVGIDLNLRNLEKAQRYAPQARFVLCDAEGAVPLPSKHFDAAVCTEMLEHLIHPERALNEIHRLLKPNGVLVGSVPGRSPIWKLRWLSNSSGKFTEEPYHKHHLRAEVEAMLSTRFHIEKLYAKFMEMNWFFIARKKQEA